LRPEKPAFSLLLGALVWLSGCGGDTALVLDISAADGAPVSSFVVVLSEGQAQRRIACDVRDADGERRHDARCRPGGVELEPLDGATEIVVKARGHGGGSAEANSAHETLRVKLAVLPTAEQTDDYATGLGAEEQAVYLSMAVSADTELGPAHVLKFYVADLQGSPTVYLQNTRKHPLHFNFAKNVLGVPGTLADFEAATYHGEDRTGMAGTLLWYPELKTAAAPGGDAMRAPLVMTFFPSDDLSPALALRAHRLIEERVQFAPLVGDSARVAYLPAGAVQSAAMTTAERSFRRRDARWLTREQLYGQVSMQLLNPGVAYGTLKLLTPEQLAKTVVSFTDILVLTRLPNQLPIVGGTITAELQTPLAHVNVAARTRGTPNVGLPGAPTDARIAPFLGKIVRFEVAKGAFSIKAATLSEAQAFWASKKKKDKFVPAADDKRADLPLFADMGFADAAAFGVKAANLAELHTLLKGTGSKDMGPKGFGVPFSAYNRHMQQGVVTAAGCDEAEKDCVQEGRAADVCAKAAALCLPGAVTESLWTHVERTMADPKFAADSVLREARLDGIRHLIGHVDVDPVFAKALDARIKEVFGDGRARLRSSTNAEDLPDFSGAGLYRSVSAYAAGKKAASSRIRKVWASVWSWRAYEERSFWNIDHRALRMGVGVNQSFVDERANGVLITQNIADPFVAGMYVNVQLGEVAVTNPEGGALAEIFSIFPAPGMNVQVARQRYSSLSPGKPIMSDAEVLALWLAAYKVQNHFALLYGKDPHGLALDLEFKLTAPDRALVIKQVRPYTDAGH